MEEEEEVQMHLIQVEVEGDMVEMVVLFQKDMEEVREGEGMEVTVVMYMLEEDLGEGDMVEVEMVEVNMLEVEDIIQVEEITVEEEVLMEKEEMEIKQVYMEEVVEAMQQVDLEFV